MFRILFCLSLVLALSVARTATMRDYRNILESKKNFLEGEWQMVDTTINPLQKGCVPNGTVEFYSNPNIPYVTFMKANKWLGVNCTKLNLIHDTALRLPFEGAASWETGLNVGDLVYGDLYFYFRRLSLLNSPNGNHNLNVSFQLSLFKNNEIPSFGLQRDVPISSLRADVPFFFVGGNWTAYKPADLSEDEERHCCVPELLSEVYFFENSTNHLTNMFAEKWVGQGCGQRVNHTVTLKFGPSADFNSAKHEYVPYRDNHDVLFRFLEPQVEFNDGSHHETIELYHKGCTITLIRPFNKIRN